MDKMGGETRYKRISITPTAYFGNVDSCPNNTYFCNKFESLSDSELQAWKRVQISEQSSNSLENQKSQQSVSRHSSGSIRTEKRKVTDELILEDFDSSAQETDKSISEKTTTIKQTGESITTNGHSSRRTYRSESEQTSSSTDEYRPFEIPIPELLVLNISNAMRMDLGSNYVHLTPEMCLRSDFFLLVNPRKYEDASSTSSASNSNNCENKETQTSSDDSSTPRNRLPSSSLGSSPRFRLTKDKIFSPRVRRNRRIYPIEEISENSENASLLSLQNRQADVELQKRLDRIAENAKNCHVKRPESRRPENKKPCWSNNSYSPKIEEIESPNITECLENAFIQEEEVLPNEVPQTPEEKPIKISLLHPHVTSQKISTHKNTKSGQSWSAINEIQVIDSTIPMRIDYHSDTSTEDRSCCSWFRRLFKKRTNSIKPTATISKTYFVRWRETPESKNSLIRTSSSFF